jgi:hypothetical protein
MTYEDALIIINHEKQQIIDDLQESEKKIKAAIIIDPAKSAYFRQEIRNAISNAENTLKAAQTDCIKLYNDAETYLNTFGEFDFFYDNGEIENELKSLYLDVARTLSRTAIVLANTELLESDKKTIIFINLDYVVDIAKGQGLGAGYRKKQITYRGLDNTPIDQLDFKKQIDVRETHCYLDSNGKQLATSTDKQETVTYMTSKIYKLLGQVEKRYIEIDIKHLRENQYQKVVRSKDANGKNQMIVTRGINPNDFLIKDTFVRHFDHLKGAVDKCKIIISGHGGSENSCIASDHQNKNKEIRHYSFNISDISSFLGVNINKACGTSVFSLDNPLPISFMSCQSAGLRAFEDRNENEIDLSNTMAGRLLIDLAGLPDPIYARVKARTTSVASLKTKIRSDVVTVTNLSADVIDDSKKEINKTIVGTPQIRRGLDGVENGKLSAFYDHTKKSDPKAYGKGYGFQGKDYRVKGYKYVFYYERDLLGNPKIKVADLSDNSNVDPVFEVNKDRLIQYIFGLAYYVYEQHGGVKFFGGIKKVENIPADVKRKKSAILKYLYDIEMSKSRLEMVTILTRMSREPDIIKNLGVKIFHVEKTRTVKLIEKLIVIVNNPDPRQNLLPLADLDNKNLGLRI